MTSPTPSTVTALHLLSAGLSQLLDAVHADDPKRELLVRVGDLMRETKSLTAALDGMVVVPKRPTLEMMEAAGNAVEMAINKMKAAGGDIEPTDYALRAVIYRAMISAVTPQAQGE